MRAFRRTVITLGLALWATSAATARMEPRQFAFQKDLEREEGARARVGMFLLDSDLYAATDARYANLRVVDANGAEVPFYLRQKIHAVTQVVESAVASRVLDFEEQKGNLARVFVEVEKPAFRAGAMILRTSHRNYEKLVAVYGGNDGKSWEPLVRDARVYDYSRHIDVRNNRVELPPNDFRYLRVDLANFVEQKKRDEFEVTTESRGELAFSTTERRTMREESIRIDGIELRAKAFSVRPDEPYLTVYASSNLTLKADEKLQTSVWTFGTDRQPLVSLSIETPSRNFSRRVVVEGSRDGDKPVWERLGEATLFNLDLETVQASQLTIPLARESRFAQYRVTVHNQDNPSLDVTAIIATGLVYEALFMADPSARYGVLYGGENIAAPRYDVGALLRNVPSIETVAYTPGDELANPLFTAGFRPGGMKPKAFFAIAMGVMVVLLAWLIAKGAGKVEKLDEPADS